ncbi:MAG: hypothetical protein RL385_3794 [Pseudomonadota bacterium]|jgi:hypothetical protein
MRRPRLFALALSSFCAQACLPDPSGLGVGLDDAARVAVLDARGTSWPNDAMPRSPRLRLWHDARITSRPPTPRTWLLRGLATPEDLADLYSARPREETRTRIVPCAEEVGAHYVELRPARPLERDTTYTFAWKGEHGVQSTPLHSSALPQAGALLSAAWPAPLAAGVPTNLRAIQLYFDGEVEDSRASVLLQRESEAQPLRLPLAPCRPATSAAASCLAAELPTPLAGSATYQVALEGSLLDACAAHVDVPSYRFTTGSGADSSPPALRALPCDADEDSAGGLCTRRMDRSLQLRAHCSEPVVASVHGCGADPAAAQPSAEVQIQLAPIPDGPCGAVLRLENAAGLHTDVPLAIAAHEPLPALSIDEVRADPFGPEPAQEYVEIFNFGPVALSLLGFTLSKEAEGRGVTFEPTFEIEPMERVLAVAPDFVRVTEPAAHGVDEEPPAGVRLVRLSAALGLSAHGTALVLRDSAGKRVSSAPAASAGHEGACIARRAMDPPAGVPAGFEADPQRRCTPGAPTAFP